MDDTFRTLATEKVNSTLVIVVSHLESTTDTRNTIYDLCYRFVDMSGGEEMATAGHGIPYSKTNSIDQEKKLLEPLAYLLQVPGKNIRKKLLHAFNLWMNVEDSKVHEIGEIVQMLHNASLLVDDIEDNSILRRGIPVAHKGREIFIFEF